MKITPAALLLFLVACAPIQNTPPPIDSSSASAVRFSVERVSPGVMRLALDNGEPHQIGYNLCPAALQRRSGTTWTPVDTDEVCTMQLLMLNPGRDATLEKRLPANLPAGEYRYVTSVESPLGTPQVGIATDPFSVS